MAVFTLNIPDADAAIVIDCLCAAGGYGEVTEANGKQALIDWITATVHNVQTSRAQPVPVIVSPITGLS